MSRRSRNARHHNPRPRPGVPGAAAPGAAASPTISGDPTATAAGVEARTDAVADVIVARPEVPAQAAAGAAGARVDPAAAAPGPEPRRDRPARAEEPAPPVLTTLPDHPADSSEFRTTCTSAQLRRFIKSRPWIPMHELRRRFGIYGDDDGVSLVRVGGRTLFIGLPAAEARLMGELLASGDVGYELSLDPVTPVVVGVYPMRPVPRG